MKRAVQPAPRDPTLAASSAVHHRAVDLYRAKVPEAGPVMDDDEWKACVRQARVEIEGVEP